MAAMDLVNGSFVIIRRLPEDTSVCVPVGIKIPQGILRLWDDAHPARWQEESEYISRVHAWMVCREAMVISPNHPQYPEWWAWFCRGRLGVVDCPPEIEKYV